jgi:hypothetical protein
MNSKSDLADKLLGKNMADVSATFGFDGFIDEVVHVVRKRINSEKYERCDTLVEYGERLKQTSGLSSNVEIVTVDKKLGGNGPILANSFINYGAKTSYIGALGYPDIDGVFKDFASKCSKVYSVCNPSQTDAVEFNDGKIIRTKLSPFQELNWEMLIKRVSVDKITAIMDNSDLIGLVNWSLVPYAGDVWLKFYDKIVPCLKASTKNKIVFFDLADPCARDEKDLLNALDTIKMYSNKFKVVLGLNLREAIHIAKLFGETFEMSDDEIKPLCEFLAQKMNIYCIMIHPVKCACCVIEGKYDFVEGPYCQKPKLTTGAGDNFNSGFLMGLLLDLDAEQCLTLGVATSGYYVRHASSANKPQMIRFLKDWQDNNIDKI